MLQLFGLAVADLRVILSQLLDICLIVPQIIRYADGVELLMLSYAPFGSQSTCIPRW